MSDYRTVAAIRTAVRLYNRYAFKLTEQKNFKLFRLSQLQNREALLLIPKLKPSPFHYEDKVVRSWKCLPPFL